jgi:DNA repair ATPase RecN
VQTRLDLIRRLSRKYGGATTGEMAEKLKEIEKELAGFESLDDDLDALTRQEKTLRACYEKTAAELTAARQALARKFEQEMEIQLRDLNMAAPNSRCPCPPAPPALRQ